MQNFNWILNLIFRYGCALGMDRHVRIGILFTSKEQELLPKIPFSACGVTMANV